MTDSSDCDPDRKFSDNFENAKRDEQIENKKLLEKDFEELFKKTPITEDTQCGYSIFTGKLLQR